MRGILFALTLLLTGTAHAEENLIIDYKSVDCIKAATSGPGGEFTHQQIKIILHSIESFWAAELKRRGLPFKEVRFHVFSGYQLTGCGPLRTGSGPVYCPQDSTVYIDPAWFPSVRALIGRPTQTLLTMVLAHEVGHHIQHALEVPETVSRVAYAQFGPAADNIDFGPPMEYQADCLAGVYMRTLRDQGLITRDEVLESVARMTRLGDDYIARRKQQLQDPTKTWSAEGGYSHGTSERRTYWFTKGLLGGEMEICEPLKYPTLH